MGKLFKSLLFGLPLVILGACSSDEPLGGDNGKEPPVADKTEVRYLKVNLVNATGGNGRAIGDDANKDYANGTEAENKIRTVDFYFYDADKEFHSHVPLSLSEAKDPTNPPANYNPSSVRGFFETDVPINLVQGDKMPQYVICIINAVQPSFYENKSMSDAQKQILTSFYCNEDGVNYFSMNNSVYYGRDEVTGTDNVLIMATPFDTSKLRTETELDKMTDAEKAEVIIDIYVERYAAKVNFNISENALDEPFEAANGIKLAFEPQKWGINAYEESFYALKSFRATSGEDPTYDSYETMNGLLFPGWNRPDHFRSFWARTPGYYDNNYPLVADDILDPLAENPKNYPYKVYYQSYNTAANDVNSSQYVIESTLKGSRLTGEGMPDQYLPLTSIPSVVLVGQYKINGTAKTFYTYQKDESDKPKIYSATSGDIEGVTQTIKERLLANQSVVLAKGSDNRYQSVRADAYNYFVVEHPKATARTGLKIGGDLVTLQISSKNSGWYYYDSSTSDYVAITTDDDIAKVNRLLYQNLGGAHAYVNGMAFFSAPIYHWGWYRSTNKNYTENRSMADWKWEEMKTGDFGIVRNHVYTLQIDNIAGLGTGIINTTDPLLPPTDKVSYAVKFRVNIQKWATLPTQKWEW